MTPRPFFLALDQGSHASKAMVFDPAGHVVAAAERPVATRSPEPGRVEHLAEEVIASLQEAITEVVAACPGVELAEAGLAIQRSSVVCWDRQSGAALSPVLSWQDRRNAAWLEQQAFDAAQLREITGLVASPHYGASKLRWCLDNLDEVRQARSSGRLCCGPLASFVLHRLLAERPCLVDPANASRTLLWNVRSHDWSASMLAACGVPRDCLPRCVPSRHRFGTLGTAAGAVPCTVATGDQSAALFARGRPAADRVFVNIGTGAFVQRVLGGTPPDAPGLLRSVAWLDGQGTLGVLEGTVNGAGAALRWLADARGVELQDLLDGADRWLAEFDGATLFLNGVGGLGAPYWASGCPVAFSKPAGLAAETAAVLESIAFLLAVNVAAVGAAGDVPAKGIVISGGLARLEGLCQRLADLSGLPVERPADIEATAHGLACLLGSAPAADTAPAALYRPQPDAALRQRFERWRAWLESMLVDGAPRA